MLFCSVSRSVISGRYPVAIMATAVAKMATDFRTVRNCFSVAYLSLFKFENYSRLKGKNFFCSGYSVVTVGFGM